MPYLSSRVIKIKSKKFPIPENRKIEPKNLK